LNVFLTCPTIPSSTTEEEQMANTIQIIDAALDIVSDGEFDRPAHCSVRDSSASSPNRNDLKQ
jgi:hypothetical protein